MALGLQASSKAKPDRVKAAHEIEAAKLNDIRREAAAVLLATGGLSLAEICRRVPCTDPTLRAWRLEPAFQARVIALTAEWREQVMQAGIASQIRRVEGQVRRHRKLERLIDARAEAARSDPEAAPGAETGLLTKTVKSIGYGESAREIREWKLDEAALKETRALEDLVAVELGQRVTKVESTHRDASEDELVALLRAQMAGLTPGDRAVIDAEYSEVVAAISE